MTSAEPIAQPGRWAGRAHSAARRVSLARAALARCRLCAHHCDVNRLAGEHGLCHAGPAARVFSRQIEVADELAIVPTYAIALSGCDLRCDFCITGAQSWNPAAGQSLSPRETAELAIHALQRGARSILFLGGEPTIHLPTVLELVAALPDEAKLVWKTNAHASAEARELLGGIFDVWVADFKFGNDVCALRLAKVPDYLQVVKENLLWASTHADLIVRHLLMPGHLKCCWQPIAAWLARELPEVKVSLHTGFWPGWHSSRHQELGRTSSQAENDCARTIAREFRLRLIE